MTATWNVYSVIREGVLFEYDAEINIGDSGVSDRLALNKMETSVLETVISFEAGREELSAGRAEAKFQSSSVPVEAPLICWLGWGVVRAGDLRDEKSNMEGDGAVEAC